MPWVNSGARQPTEGATRPVVYASQHALPAGDEPPAQDGGVALAHVDATLGATRSSEAELHEVGRRGLSSLNGVTWGTTTGPSSTKERSRTLERQETR